MAQVVLRGSLQYASRAEGKSAPQAGTLEGGSLQGRHSSAQQDDDTDKSAKKVVMKATRKGHLRASSGNTHRGLLPPPLIPRFPVRSSSGSLTWHHTPCTFLRVQPCASVEVPRGSPSDADGES